MEFFDLFSVVLDQGQVFSVWLFSLFKDAHVAIGLALSMIALCIGLLLWLQFVKIAPVANDLSWVSRQIGQLRSYGDFVDTFPKVDAAVSSIPVVAHGWGELKKTLVFPEEGSRSAIRNTESVAHFINMDAAAEAGLDFRFYRAMADYFVGIGLVFTFLGLVSALGFAAEGLAADDPEETKQQFANLLHAATFKFLTSIVGVAMSIIFSIVQRRLIARLNEHFIGLVEVLEERMIFASQEAIAFAQFREMRKQNALLQRIESRFGSDTKDSARGTEHA